MLSKTSVFMCATLQVCNFANPFANALRRNLRQRNIPWSTWQLRGPHGSSGQLQAAPLVHMAAPGTFLTSRWVHPWSTCHPEATIRYLEVQPVPHRSNYLCTKTDSVIARGIARFHPPHRGQSDPRVTPGCDAHRSIRGPMVTEADGCPKTTARVFA